MQSATLHQEVGFISLDFNLEVEGEKNVDCRGKPRGHGSLTAARRVCRFNTPFSGII